MYVQPDLRHFSRDISLAGEIQMFIEFDIMQMGKPTLHITLTSQPTYPIQACALAVRS